LCSLVGQIKDLRQYTIGLPVSWQYAAGLLVNQQATQWDFLLTSSTHEITCELAVYSGQFCELAIHKGVFHELAIHNGIFHELVTHNEIQAMLLSE